MMFTVFQKKMTVLSSVSNAYVDDTDCPFIMLLYVCGHFIAQRACICWHISGPLLYVGMLL